MEAGCSCFSKSLMKMKKLMPICIFTLLFGASKIFMEAIKVVSTFFETPQRSLKIRIKFFFFPSRIGVGRVKLSSF